MQTSWAHVLHTLPFGPLPVPCQDKPGVQSPREPTGHPP